MIRVTVEIFPYGDESRRRKLAHLDIANDGTGDHVIGNYKYRAYNEAGSLWKSGTLTGFKRSRYTVLWLLALVLRSAFPKMQEALVDPRTR